MAASGVSKPLHRDFENDDAIVEYYSRKFSRPQINRYAELVDVEIDGKRIEDDCRRLLEEDSLETYHWYESQLSQIGPDTLVEGIQQAEYSSSFVVEQYLRPKFHGGGLLRQIS